MSKPQLETPSLYKGARTINLSEMYPVIFEVLAGGGSFTLTPNGSSMYPTLIGGRDQITMVKPTGRLKKGDLPLYRRESGQFVLHRVVAVEPDGSYTCCGDHQWALEKGIRHEQIVGVVTDYVRKGKHFSDNNRCYRRYVRFWVWFLRGRKYFFTGVRYLGNVKRWLQGKKKATQANES